MKGKLSLLLLILCAGNTMQAQKSVDVINYINTYKSLAISEMQRSGIPASIILAQGIHETEAGTSDLVQRSNNHFGIKCKDDWKGGTVFHDDDSKGECFRSYDNSTDSYRDHSEFLLRSSRYAFLFKLNPEDFEGWAYGLRKAGYATNIRYSQILIKIIRDYNLQQYSLIAMGKLNPSEEIVLRNPGDGNVPGAVLPMADALAGSGNGTAGKGNSGNAGASGGNGQAAGNGQTDGSGRVKPAPSYPDGEFSINKARVIFARSGVSLLSIAEKYELPLAHLLDFNDLKEEDILARDQLLFLQRKRRVGAVEFHIVQEGETLYEISQFEGVRYQDLLELNQLDQGKTGPGVHPAAGEKIYLQTSAPSRPVLADGRKGL
ncbi:glucosaminidase domain-containing protein [Flavitalea flava]